MDGDCLIEAESLEVGAGGRTILSVPRLRLGPGLHGIIGPNGSGKTTLLRALAGVASYSGSARVCGREPSQARRYVGYMPAYPQVDSLALARNVVEAGAYGTGRGPDIEGAAAIVGVEELLDRRFHTLSGGERRLVCLARVLARNPRVLLLDEPLSFLDLRNVSRVIKLLRSLSSEGRIVVVTAHELQYVSVFDTVTLLVEGSIAYHGKPDRLPLGLLEEAYKTRLAEAWLDGNRIILPGDIFGSSEG